jgi:hypothetical protein
MQKNEDEDKAKTDVSVITTPSNSRAKLTIACNPH